MEILDNLLNSNSRILDEYLGIDTEWKSSKTFLEHYVYNLKEHNKNKDIIKVDKSNLSDIIQIAGNDFGIVFDTKSIYKNKDIIKVDKSNLSDIPYSTQSFRQKSITKKALKKIFHFKVMSWNKILKVLEKKIDKKEKNN